MKFQPVLHQQQSQYKTNLNCRQLVICLSLVDIDSLFQRVVGCLALKKIKKKIKSKHQARQILVTPWKTLCTKKDLQIHAVGIFNFLSQNIAVLINMEGTSFYRGKCLDQRCQNVLRGFDLILRRKEGPENSSGPHLERSLNLPLETSPILN